MKKLIILPALWFFRHLSVQASYLLVIGMFLPAPLLSLWLITSGKVSLGESLGIYHVFFLLSGLAFLVGAYLFIMLSIWYQAGMARMSVAFERFASGDLATEVRPPTGVLESKSVAGRIWVAVVQTRANLYEIVSQTRVSAAHIAHGAHEIASGYNHLSQRTEEQAATLEETAASMESLSSAVKQNAENCRQANTRALETNEHAEVVGQLMQKASDTMSRLESGSKKISEIIGLIEGIAFQTNILALNAAVEAARAGEQGRGFSVVASEVRSLAQRCSQAADEIKNLVNVSHTDVTQSSAHVGQAHQATDRAITAIRELSTLIDAIATASTEQSTGVQEVSRALQQLEQVTQQNAALVEEGAATSASFDQEAGRLMRVVEAFKIDETQTPPEKVPQAPRPVAPVPTSVPRIKRAL